MTEIPQPEVLEEDLSRRWHKLALEFPRTDPEVHQAVLEELFTCWQTTDRKYHTVEHLAETLTQIQLLEFRAANPVNLELAGWYHDAIYVPGDKHSESASAVLAAQHMYMLGFKDAERIGHVMDLIKGTADHFDKNDDPDFKVLSDADMAILAAEPERYDRYARAIREEYSKVPDDIWRSDKGRPKVLRTFVERLESGQLFFTPEMQALEERAETNLKRELTVLLN